MDTIFTLWWNLVYLRASHEKVRIELTTRPSTFVRLFVSWAALAPIMGLMTVSALSQELPRPPEIEPDIRFWTRVYTEIDTASGFIHDSRELSVVYRTIRFVEGASGRVRSRQVRDARDEVEGALAALASGKRQNLTAEEQRVLAAWPEAVSNRELGDAVSRVRFQLGQSDRFRAGYIRSGRWKPFIRSVLREQGVPQELVALPHVESSFNPTAYSKVGAAGMWQFTRSTGLRYMRIDHIVDERRDPYLATVAAARLLRDNYDVLENWALAITAYNHGQAGMRNAVRATETNRIEVILREYTGRRFGFASRNFYVAFLAASDVDANAEEYFGPLTTDAEAEGVLVDVPDFLTASTLASSFDMSHRELRSWNPALTEAVWSEDKFVPRGFELRLPAGLSGDSARLMASVPDSQRFTVQKPDILHRVRRGDTLSGIADRYRVSQASLMALNNLRSRHFIREGQELRLPGNDGTTPVALAALNSDPTSDGGVYVVRAGDSIDRIARMFGISPRSLQARNGITDVNRIYVGQELRVGDASQDSEARGSLVVAVAETPASADVTESEAQAAVVVPPQVAPEIDPQAVAAIGAVQQGPEPPQVQPPYASAADQLVVEAALAVIVDTGLVDSRPSAEELIEDALAESLEVNVLASVQAEMAADPSDYLVREDQTVEVQALETLGHYADWLEIRTQRLRDINGMPFRQAVVIGHRLKLDFSRVSLGVFEERRMAYQRQTQEAFFLAYQVSDTHEHVVRAGESLWVLALRRYQVPVWLLRQYNPDLDLDLVRPGTVVKFPELRPIAEADNVAQAGVQG